MPASTTFASIHQHSAWLNQRPHQHSACLNVISRGGTIEFATDCRRPRVVDRRFSERKPASHAFHQNLANTPLAPFTLNQLSAARTNCRGPCLVPSTFSLAELAAAATFSLAEWVGRPGETVEWAAGCRRPRVAESDSRCESHHVTHSTRNPQTPQSHHSP